VQVHYVPIYRHPLFAPFGVAPSDFPETEQAYAGLLSLPMYPGLTEREQLRVTETLAAALCA
jgi:dTDP-4-amino-4,6-dideoxygalactose transaminase